MSVDTKTTGPTVDLANYRPTGYSRGAGIIRSVLWYITSNFLYVSPWFPFYQPKRGILRLFGANVGKGVIIKPRVRIKHPWKLSVGSHSWIGEGVWIDNLAEVVIGSNVCVSQDAYVLTGNHDYKARNFPLITGPIVIEDGAWVGARAVVCPGTTVSRNSVVTVGSVLSRDTEIGGIYSGNPAVWVRERQLRDTPPESESPL